MILRRIVGALPIAEQERVRKDIVREFRAGTGPELKINEARKTWRASANREFEPKARTLQGYDAMWRRFQRWAETSGLVHLDDISRANAETYAADLWDSSVSPSTFNQHIKLLRGVFQSLEHRAGLAANPWSHLKSRKRALDEGRRNLTETELAEVLHRAKGNLRLMLHLGLFTGLRLGDVVNLQWDNVEYDPILCEPWPGVIVLIPLKTSRYRKKLDLPIHPVLSLLIAEHKLQAPQPCELLFPKKPRLTTPTPRTCPSPSNVSSNPAALKPPKRPCTATVDGRSCASDSIACGTAS